jgi:hypothetical protein
MLLLAGQGQDLPLNPKRNQSQRDIPGQNLILQFSPTKKENHFPIHLESIFTLTACVTQHSILVKPDKYRIGSFVIQRLQSW